MPKILDRLQATARTTPNMLIRLTSGLAGLFMPTPFGTTAKGLMEGEFEDAFNSAAYNYAGVHIYGRNDFGSMFKRCKGTWVAIMGNILADIVSDVK